MTGTLIIGLSIAMMLFLLAAGLTIIFGMLGVINFAHGVLYMVKLPAAVSVLIRVSPPTSRVWNSPPNASHPGVVPRRCPTPPASSRSTDGDTA